MNWTPPSVRFAFRLPPTLLHRVEPGAWPRAPRSVSVEVAGDGAVEISCTNGSEIYAFNQVLQTAGSFIRSIEKNAPTLKIRAALTAPSCKRPIGYMIVVGARVSIARTDEAPEVFGNALLAVEARAKDLARACAYARERPLLPR
jgi:hypothetical protein